MLSRFLAGEMGWPFVPVNSLVGTDMAAAHQRLAFVDDPWHGGRRVPIVPALRPDVSIVHVQQADPDGNLVIDGVLHHEPEMIRASRATIVTCDELAGHDSLRGAGRTTIPGEFVTAVVEQPFGASPTASYGRYDYDARHIEHYQACARGGGKPYSEYLDRYVLGVESHDEFLERAGLRERVDPHWRRGRQGDVDEHRPIHGVGMG